MGRIKAKSIPEYIAKAPKEARAHLRGIYAALKRAAPGAKEGLKWSSPVFEERRILFAFAAFKTHLNFMPTPSVMKAFKTRLARYKTGLGSIRFPYDEPLPTGLIARMAKRRVKELRERDARWM